MNVSQVEEQIMTNRQRNETESVRIGNTKKIDFWFSKNYYSTFYFR